MQSDKPSDLPFADAPFPYMRFAKTHLMEPNPLSLGLSGMPTPENAPAWATSGNYQKGFTDRLMERYGVTADQIHATSGSSHANFVAYLALAKAGHVIAERPAYEALHRLAGAVGAELSFVERVRERDWQLDLSALTKSMNDSVSLIALTDLHNPTGVRVNDEDYEYLGTLAERHNAFVLVDEVYADFDPVERPTAAMRHPRFLVTNSLTKVHGHSYLRAGWILGAPEVIERIARWDDLVCPALPPQPLAQAAVVMVDAQGNAANARRLAYKRTKRVDSWVRATEGVSWIAPHGGLTGLLQFDSFAQPGDAVSFCKRLSSSHGVVAIPGDYFQRPDSIRISFGLELDLLNQALGAIELTLHGIS